MGSRSRLRQWAMIAQILGGVGQGIAGIRDRKDKKAERQELMELRRRADLRADKSLGLEEEFGRENINIRKAGQQFQEKQGERYYGLAEKQDARADERLDLEIDAAQRQERDRRFQEFLRLNQARVANQDRGRARKLQEKELRMKERFGQHGAVSDRIRAEAAYMTAAKNAGVKWTAGLSEAVGRMIALGLDPNNPEHVEQLKEFGRESQATTDKMRRIARSAIDSVSSAGGEIDIDAIMKAGVAAKQLTDASGETDDYVRAIGNLHYAHNQGMLGGAQQGGGGPLGRSATPQPGGLPLGGEGILGSEETAVDRQGRMDFLQAFNALMAMGEQAWDMVGSPMAGKWWSTARDHGVMPPSKPFEGAQGVDHTGQRR